MRNVYVAKGFSLIELILVVAVAATLIGMLLPAVQQVRETANRAKCANNLKQVGLAFHAYHSDFSVLPPGKINSGLAGGQDNNYWQEFPMPIYNHTAFVLLLPYIDHDALYRQYDLRSPAGRAYGPHAGVNGPTSPVGSVSAGNAEVVSTYIEIYACPSDEFPQVDSFDESSGVDAKYFVTTARRSNYVMSSLPGDEHLYGKYAADYRPMFGANGAARFEDVADGLSMTIMAGEKKQMAAVNAVSAPSQVMPVTHWGVGSWFSVFGAAGFNGFGINYPTGGDIFGFSPSHPGYRLNQRPAFGSWHRGGANLVFGDCSVHFLREGIDPTLFKAMGTIAGGETVAFPDA